MLKETLVILFNISGNFHCVNGCAATFLLDVSAKSKGLSSTARVLPLVASILEFRFLRMVSAVKEFATNEIRFTDCALEGDKSRPDLPVNVLPLDVLLVVHELDKAVEVEEAVSHMLSYNLTMEIDEDLGVCTHHPLILLACI